MSEQLKAKDMLLRIDGFEPWMAEGATIASNWHNQSLGLQAYFDLRPEQAMECIRQLLAGQPVELRFRPQQSAERAGQIARSLSKCGFVCGVSRAD